MNGKLLLEAAKTLDAGIIETWKKYEKKKQLNGKDWLVEYAILNWRGDFFAPYQALCRIQESLRNNIGKWGYSRHATDLSSLIVFQVSDRLLVPGKITRLPESNYEKPNGFRANLGFGIEPEYLKFSQARSFNGYAVDKDGGVLHFPDDGWKYIKELSTNSFMLDLPVNLIQTNGKVEMMFGDEVPERLSSLMEFIGYQSGESPLDCIRRLKGKNLSYNAANFSKTGKF